MTEEMQALLAGALALRASGHNIAAGVLDRMRRDWTRMYNLEVGISDAAFKSAAEKIENVAATGNSMGAEYYTGTKNHD